jgi:hypothetical protein
VIWRLWPTQLQTAIREELAATITLEDLSHDTILCLVKLLLRVIMCIAVRLLDKHVRGHPAFCVVYNHEEVARAIDSRSSGQAQDVHVMVFAVLLGKRGQTHLSNQCTRGLGHAALAAFNPCVISYRDALQAIVPKHVQQRHVVPMSETAMKLIERDCGCRPCCR